MGVFTFLYHSVKVSKVVSYTLSVVLVFLYLDNNGHAVSCVDLPIDRLKNFFSFQYTLISGFWLKESVVWIEFETL